MSEKTSNPKPMTGLWANAATLAMVLFLSALLFIATLFVGAGILLVGRILILVFPVSLFEASLIALVIAGSIVFLVYQITRLPRVLPSVDDDWDEDEDWDDYDEDEDFEDDADEEDDVIIPPRSRNDPCPCGSGKKYKHCHGRVA
ncbi:MAG: SEC-C domain-containing protein [Chloroflexi bacterium]|nr:SEC-C domain-containing protein [Chloroflexota bacterium]